MAKWLAWQTAVLTTQVRFQHETLQNFSATFQGHSTAAFYDAITGRTEFVISIVNSVKMVNWIGWWKKNYLLFTWEKNVLKTIISMSSHPKFVLRLFLKNIKKTNCKENIRFLGGSCRKCIYNFTDITKWLILFHLQTVGAGRHISSFLNFWKIKIWEANQNIFLKKSHFALIFSLRCVFLLERDRKRKKLRMWRSRQFNLIQKVVYFCLIGQKLWEQIHF